MVQIYGNSYVEEESDDEGDIEVTKVSINDAIQALETLRLYEMQQEEGSTSTLQLLDRIGRGFAATKARLTTQKQCVQKYYFRNYCSILAQKYYYRNPLYRIKFQI